MQCFGPFKGKRCIALNYYHPSRKHSRNSTDVEASSFSTWTKKCKLYCFQPWSSKGLVSKSFLGDICIKTFGSLISSERCNLLSALLTHLCMTVLCHTILFKYPWIHHRSFSKCVDSQNSGLSKPPRVMPYFHYADLSLLWGFHHPSTPPNTEIPFSHHSCVLNN